MKKFEHSVITSEMNVPLEELTKAGQEGHELICIQQIGIKLHYFFKKELTDEKPRGKQVKKTGT